MRPAAFPPGKGVIDRRQAGNDGPCGRALIESRLRGHRRDPAAQAFTLLGIATPRFGGFLVAGWLGGIIVRVLLIGGYGAAGLRPAPGRPHAGASRERLAAPSPAPTASRCMGVNAQDEDA